MKSLSDKLLRLNFIRISTLILIFIYVLFSIMNYLNFFVEEIICSVDEMVMHNNKEYLIAKNYGLINEANKTDERAQNGKCSVRLIPECNFGLSFLLDVPKPKDEYEASVWVHMEKISEDTAGSGFLVASSGQIFWKGENIPVEMKNGWGLLHLKFSIPEGNYNEPLKIFCWNSSKNIYYFDNISIKRKNYWKYFKN